MWRRGGCVREGAYQVLSAINLLSINAKLTLLKSENPVDADELSQAKRRLTEFASELADLLEKAGKREGHAILGTDLRMRQLVSHFRQMTRSSPLGNSVDVTRDDLQRLLEAEDESSLGVLIEYLDLLRSLVEQYSYSDV